MDEPLRGHQSEFSKMPTYRIDGLGPLAHHKVTNAKHHGRSLLLFALHGHEPHGRPLGCFADRFGVSGIVLLPLHERLDVTWSNQPDSMSQLRNLPRPVMAAGTCLHGDRAGRLRGKEPKHLIAAQLFPEQHTSRRIPAMHLEHILRQIQPDCVNFRHGRLRSSDDHRHHFGTAMPSGGVHHNYATHKTPKIKAWLARRPHYHVHFTPTSASWINQVERWFAELTRKQIQRGVHTSVRQLEADIRTFIELHNKNPKPFKWSKSADQILASVKRFCHKERLYVANFRFT
ncbi:transposase [Bradyrhizobium sp. USDA 336]